MTSNTRLVMLIGIALVVMSIITYGETLGHETYLVVGITLVMGAVWNWIFDTEGKE